MVKTNTTISIDSEIKEKAIEILHSKGLKLSSYVEEMLNDYVQNNQKEVKG